MLTAAGKAASRMDAGYVAACLFRAIGLCAHALHARDGVWVTNEKGLVASVDSLPIAPAAFAERVEQIFATVARDPSTALAAADDLRAEVAAAVAG